jgi:hypothetical protein
MCPCAYCQGLFFFFNYFHYYHFFILRLYFVYLFLFVCFNFFNFNIICKKNSISLLFFYISKICVRHVPFARVLHVIYYSSVQLFRQLVCLKLLVLMNRVSTYFATIPVAYYMNYAKNCGK